MKKNYLSLAILLALSASVYSQVGVGTNTPDADSVLELKASDKGLLLPRVALTDVTLATPLTAHVQGMVVYNTAATITGYVGNAEGIWRNDGTQWRRGTGTGVSGIDWSLSGNAGTTAGTDFLGTTDAQDLVFKVDNTPSGRINIAKLNTSLGYGSNNNKGSGNTAIGANALAVNKNGVNVAVGSGALSVNTNGKYSTAIGNEALINSQGSGNTVLGSNSGTALTTGSKNILIGAFQDATSPTIDNSLNIGGAIFGTGLTGNQSAPAGNIGIGTSTPTAKLDVNGNAKIQSIPAGAVTDEVVTTDASGNIRKVSMSSVATSGLLSYVEESLVTGAVDFTTWVNGTLLPFTVENLDDHSDFDTSTYTFTAPANGMYEISGTLAFEGIVLSSADQVAVTSYMNFTGAASSMDGRYSETFTNDATFADAFHIPFSRLVHMDAGDTMTMDLHIGSAGSTPFVSGALQGSSTYLTIQQIK